MAQPASDMPPYDAPACVRGLRDAKRIALLMAPRLGDTLLMMTMAHNLVAHGREVTIFGDFAYGLRSWFPGLDIHPSLLEQDAATVLADYDCAAQMHVGWPYALHGYAKSYFYYDAHVVITGKGFVKLNQISDFCRDVLRLPLSGTDIGLRPPVTGRHRRHETRVAVHPSSTGAQRCWAPRHFVELGLRLKRQGYDPVFILAPHERAEWTCLTDAGLAIQQSPSLADVAAFIHECGWFIGNESGIGHLASSVGVPTLTLTGRPTRTKAWRPGWTMSRIAYPVYIPGGRWRDRLWRDWLRPGSVMAAFEGLTRDYKKSMSTLKRVRS
ncbi:glycosyltransferase family 9 protein [Achromobacter sp. DH1f]|uniref:glycosyltransferase family 9 protein n=1 Tax=Achromobacter sp. DH1f TaxID=1397275 RepID=UPI000469B694|nr:glycosyltransferase family 9 protein [Achromobacter sp. DH1f]